MRFPRIILLVGSMVMLEACGAGVGVGGGVGGSAASQATPAAVLTTPTAVLTVDHDTVASGAASTLTWSSTGATSCNATGGWSGSLATSGTQSSGALTADTTFSLTCVGAGGTSAASTTKVTIAPPPTVTLAASPTTLTAGAASTLTWTSGNATACSASGAWTGPLPVGGSQGTGALTANSIYSISCSGAGGTSPVGSATVTVTPVVTAPQPPAANAPTATLGAYPSVVTTGSATTLTWSSTNATSCAGTGGPLSGALAAAGTAATGALTASTTFSLTCSGPGGTSAVTTQTVTISDASVTVTPRTAAITLTRTQQFTATVPGGAAATWTVDGVVGGNPAVGSVGVSGLYTAGTAAGMHTVTVTSTANTAESASAVVAVTDLAGVYTYHNDNARDGTNTREYALTTASVNTAGFGRVASCAVDGAVYSQPLWVANVTVGGAKHNVVYAATEHDGLFAFDADASPCAKLWSVNLIDAAHGAQAGELPVPSNRVGVGAGDIQPEVGITGTPVIDPATGILYVVTKSTNAAQNTFYQRLHAIDIATGVEKPGAPLLIAGTYPGTGDGGATVVFNALQQLQRTGLALVNGQVYVAFTAHEDKAPWYGWMMSYQYAANALTQKSVLNVAPNKQRGGIWMSGGAPAADADGNLYVITGNGEFDASDTTAPNNDYGDSLLQLTQNLTVSQWFTPADQANYALNDVDFGSGGATVLADLPAGNTIIHALICGGKDNQLYVLNRDMLGGFGVAGLVQKINFITPIFATGAFWNNAFYLGGVGGALQRYELSTATAQLALKSASSHVYGFAGATPSVSSTATQNGIVWTLETRSYCTNQSKSCGPAVLYAHDAGNVATELWNSSATADAAGYAVKFTLPTVANGRVYVGTRGNNIGAADTSTSLPGELDIYGLKP